MVETATFRSFHRAAHSNPPQEASEPPVGPVNEALPAPGALSARFVQELRVRRQIMRDGLHNKPDASLLAPVDLVTLERPFPPPNQSATQWPGADASILHETAVDSFEDAAQNSDAGLPVPNAPLPRVSLPHVPSVEAMPYLRGTASHGEQAADDPKSTVLPSLQAQPGAIHESAPIVLTTGEEPGSLAPMPGDRDAGSILIAPSLPVADAPLAASTVDAGVHPVVVFELRAPADDATPEPEPPAIMARSEPPAIRVEPAAEPITQTPAPAIDLQHQYRSEPFQVDYQLLGLANPLVCTVISRLGDADPIRLSIGRTGIYRPEGHRAAPWNGLAYDISHDGRAGFMIGASILTARGEVPVEELVPGDCALTLRGPALLPIAWIGRSIASAPAVQIDADAFGPGRPGKTLRVGADHLIFMQTDPLPAHALVNGSSIHSLEEEAELFHIDVGVAEVLLAEGIPVASGRR